MKEFIKIILSILCVLLILGILFPIVSEIVLAIDTTIAHNRIEKFCFATEEKGVYVAEQDMTVSNELDCTLTLLPTPIRDTIQKDWYIVISENSPYGKIDSSIVDGATNFRAKVIWIKPDFSKKVLMHEIGHAMAGEQNLDYSKEFRLIYNSFWEKDLTNNKEYDAHDTSTTSELFALLFEQYFCSPENLKVTFMEGYNYIDNFVQDYNVSLITLLINPFIKNYTGLGYVLKKLLPSIGAPLDAMLIEASVKDNPMIDVNNYTPYSSVAGLSEKERVLAQNIIDAIEHPELYPSEMCGETYTTVLKCDWYISYANYLKIAGCVDFWLGEEQSNVFDINANQTYQNSTIRIYTDDAKLLKENRNRYEKNIEEVLGQLHEGTETQKLLQISKYIAENSEYDKKTRTSCNDFWADGTGDCVTYAMVFRQFCERLGIQCDIVMGTTLTGEGHAWNRVRLSDGTYRYYDLTYYRFGKLDMPQYDDNITLAINGYVAH
ncbi:MAG: hypothetical protein IJZ42_13605 [Lachnospiraceae bacterium]|nr:hypothetical protein [Lachnospiraceae bacterium]